MAAAGHRRRRHAGRDRDSGQLATARLAGMPPETGLYAFAAGSLAFAAFGANRFMSVVSKLAENGVDRGARTRARL
jgi:hypothetical protein